MQPVIYADPASAAHDGGPGHPERPERLSACLEALDRAGLTVTTTLPPATDAQLAGIHDAAYLGRLQRFCQRGGGSIDSDTYAVPESFDIARRAAGACCLAVDRALAANQRSFCLVRPPGHHASRSAAMGFCLVNHAAVAAAHALSSGAPRVAIVDPDVHHGNGTQDIFWEDPRVLYISLHQFPWYPGSGRLEDTGGGEGAGTTINVPLPAGSTETIYLAAMQRIVIPALVDFSPEVIIVSAGFDAHTRDPLGSMELTAGGFGLVASLLASAAEELCGGRLVMTLEGGYDLAALASSVAATIASIAVPTQIGEPVAAAGPQACREALERAVTFHRPGNRSRS